MQPPRQRTAEEERARAAAKQAEKELWERTRGAGSAVFNLADAGIIKQQRKKRVPPKHSLHLRQLLGQASANGSSTSVSDREGASRSDDAVGQPSAAKHISDSSSPSSPSSSSSAARSLDEEEEELLPWTERDVLPSLEDVEAKRFEAVEVPSGDVLLSRGICEYTLLPKVLGRGKFSTVFMASKKDELWAVKHTALFPHHQLIATRLLREPTLLAELPPHPNLVAVKETIRTPGHFYLIEEYLQDYVTLEALIPMYSDSHPPILPPDIADRIMTQLLSAVRAIHTPLQICHRDIKPENILVHPKTLQLKLLDFGLATHFSRSEPKLSTCCGSPAFHCPEIVKALSSPPGSVVYMGPEVDAWTCGVTMLRCLTGARFPLGASHSSLRGMAIRAQRAVASISDPTLRIKVGALLDMDGRKRMQKFEDLVVEQERVLGEPSRGPKQFKSTTFIPSEPTHSIRLPIVDGSDMEEGLSTAAHTPGFMTPTSASRRTTPANSRPASPTRSPAMMSTTHLSSSSNTSFTALNPTHQPPERVVSFIKYCLRCAGILYHTWADVPIAASPGKGDHTPHQYSHSPTPVRGVSAAFAEAAGLPLDAASTPWTPLFPPTLAASEERSDGLAHVQIFQCVVELPTESERDADGSSQGRLSLVQSIMAAFSRKLAPSSAQQEHNQQQEQQHQSRAASPAARAGMGKRSMSTPARSRSDRPVHTPAPLSKDGNVRCLTFHLVVRFPKQASGAPLKQAMSRNSSFFGPSVYEGSPWGTRSRTSSVATTPLLGSDAELAEAKDEEAWQQPQPQQQAQQQQPPPPQPQPQSSAARARTQIKEREGRLRQVKVLEDVGLTAIDTQRTPTDLANLHLSATRPDRSPSASRPQSRTRKRSFRGNSSRRAKVLFHVSDERAVQMVKNALSIGGTVESKLQTSTAAAHRDGSSTPTAGRAGRGSSVPPPPSDLPGLHGLSAELVRRGASAKELSLAIQERLELIATGSGSGFEEEQVGAGDEQDSGAPATAARSLSTVADAEKERSSVVEVTSLLQHLGMVLPRIKTQRPHKFIEPLVALVPRSLRAALKTDHGKTKGFRGANHESTMSSEALAHSRSRQDPNSTKSSEETAMHVCEAVISLEGLVCAAQGWCDAIDSTSAISHTMLVQLVLGSMIALVPQLPKPDRSESLSLWYFKRWRPHYAFGRPSDPPQPGPNSPNSDVKMEKISSRAWELLRSLFDLLKIDLELLALERPHLNRLANGSADAAITSMGAFMSLVSLEAHDRNRVPTPKGAEAKWSTEDALRRLGAALPLITATLGTERPVTTSNTGADALGGAAFLPDTTLTWTMWCVEGMRSDTRMADEDATILVHTLATHAALCPDPPSRHIALELVRSLLVTHIQPTMTLDILQDLVLESPYPQLRVASVGVARGLILQSMEQPLSESQDVNISFATPVLLERLGRVIFTLPAALPEPTAETSNEVKTFLEDHVQWLSECLGFVYVVVSRDTHNNTGIRSPAQLEKMKAQLIQPLEGWIEAWLDAVSISPPSEPAAGRSGDESPPERANNIALPLSMLQVAVQRAAMALADAVGSAGACERENPGQGSSHTEVAEENTECATQPDSGNADEANDALVHGNDTAVTIRAE